MTQEQPPQIYYPNARCRFYIRFEEFEKKDTPEPPKKPPQLRDGKGNPELDVVDRDGVLLLEAKGAGSQDGPTVAQPSSSDGLTHVVDGVIPVAATLCRNGIRIADTLKLSLNFADFPFDPRLIRSVGIEFFLGTVPEADFQRAVEGEASEEGQNPLAMIGDTFTDRRGRLRSNLRFQGWVDDWSADFEEEDSPLVSMDCTDSTRILIDEDAPPKLVIAAGTPLVRAIADYLSNFPQFRGIGVAYRPVGGQQPVLKDAFAVSAFKPELGPSPNGGGKLTVWDYITDVCGAVGHIVNIETVMLADGSFVPVIIVRRPRTLYAAKFAGRPDDPFTGRILPTGRELAARTFIFGRNLLSLSLSRKFSRYQPQNIEVRCYVPKDKKCLVVRYPQKEDRQKSLKPGDQAEQKWETIRVDGIGDEKTLRALAQGIYEQRQRNELAVSARTKNLASYGGGNFDPDALDIQSGDTVEVEVDRSKEEANTIVAVEDAAATRAREFLKSLGFSDELATTYERASRNLNFPTSFRVRQLSVEWDITEGVSLNLECVNFLEVRSDVELPEGEEVEPTDTPSNEPEQVEVGT